MCTAPKVPKAPQPPAPVQENTASELEAGDRERRRRMAGGFASTLLTGPAGTGSASTTGKTLLGM